MIQAFQKFSQSRVAKIFLAIVALSFVAFFGGGSWFRPHDPYAVIAQVGNLSIGRNEFFQKVQMQAQQVMAKTGETLSREDIFNAGIPQVVLNQMIQEILLNLETKNLGLTVSDEQVKNQIQSLKVFQDENGVFNRTLFANVLRANGLSEDSFIEEIRRDLIREQLGEAISAGVIFPESMVDPLFEAQYQHRQASLVVVSPKEISPPPAPSQEILEAFYNQHQQDFETPELRTITALVIDPIVLGQNEEVADEEIKAIYEGKTEVYGGKPLAQVKSLIIAERKKEKGIEKASQLSQELDDKIAGGATLEELASLEKGLELIKLEGVDSHGFDRMKVISPSLPKNQELAAEMLQTAFSLEEAMDNPFTQAKTGAYYMIRVDKVSPSHIQPFAEIRNLVLKVWNEFEQIKGAQAKAKDYVKSFNQGDRKVSLMKLLPTLSLSEPSPEVSDEVKQLVFSLRPGRAGMVYSPEGFAVVVLNRIIPPTEKVKTDNMDAFKKNMLKAYKEDFIVGYLNALRIRYPVKVNRDAVKVLFSEKG